MAVNGVGGSTGMRQTTCSIDAMDAPARPPLLPRCPECGTDSITSALPRGRWFGRPRLVPVLIAVVVVGTLAVLYYRGRSAFSFAFSRPLTDSATVLLPPVTLGDLRRIAAQDPDARTDLIPLLLAQAEGRRVEPPGRSLLYVRLTGKRAFRWDHTGIGWPNQWFWSTSSGSFEDALVPTGAIPTTSPQGPQSHWVDYWYGTLSFKPPPSVHNEFRSLTLTELSIPFSMLVLAWYVGKLGRSSWNRFRATKPQKPNWVQRHFPLILVLAVASAIGLLTVGSTYRSYEIGTYSGGGETVIDDRHSYGADIPHATSLDARAIRQTERSSAGSAGIAAEILLHVPQGKDDSLLAVQFEPNTVVEEDMFELRSPFLLFSHYTIRRFECAPEKRWELFPPGALRNPAARPQMAWPQAPARFSVRDWKAEYVLATPA